MKNYVKIMTIVLFSTFAIYSDFEYLYPVAELDNENLLVMHQKSVDDLELLVWNQHQKVAFKELSSMFLPSCVQILPGKKAYSFIDRGRIRIKFFQKRAPRAIDIYEPIHAIVSMNWISDEQFYFVGKHAEQYGLFLCDVSDRSTKVFFLSPLHSSYDFMYPCKIEDKLFCITKDVNDTYGIAKLPWAPRQYQQELQEFSAGIKSSGFHFKRKLNQGPLDLMLKHDKPLCFLTMESEHSGFVLELSTSERDLSFLDFTYCSVSCDNENNWSLKKLFEFHIPKNFLIGTGAQRVHESMYPFLPQHHGKDIFFVTFDLAINASIILQYDQVNGQIDPYSSNLRSFDGNTNFLAPFFAHDKIYCGFSSYFNSRSYRSVLNIDQETGIIDFDLPTV